MSCGIYDHFFVIHHVNVSAPPRGVSGSTGIMRIIRTITDMADDMEYSIEEDERFNYKWLRGEKRLQAVEDLQRRRREVEELERIASSLLPALLDALVEDDGPELRAFLPAIPCDLNSLNSYLSRAPPWVSCWVEEFFPQL